MVSRLKFTLPILNKIHLNLGKIMIGRDSYGLADANDSNFLATGRRSRNAMNFKFPKN